MGRFGFALAAAAALLVGSAPLAAHAADAKPDKSIDKGQQAKGMKEAPAVMAAAGAPCTVTDAYFLGQSTQKDEAGKDYQAKIYEVACKEGLGYILVSGKGDAKPKTYDCLTTESNASLSCRLPENAHPEQALGPLMASAGQQCTVKGARAVGQTPTGATFFEVACQDDGGYILQTGGPTPAKATPCLATAETNLACTLTTKADSVAAVAKLAAASGKPCQVSDARYVGSTTTDGGATFYEVACGAQPGFMIQADARGAFKQAINCGAASGIGGGCTMTDTTKAQTQEADTYTGLAKAGGYNCNVSRYRYIGIIAQPKAEVVELACSNRPDGVVAVFPDAAGVKARFVDCIQGGQFGAQGQCKLTSLAPLYAKYSAALAAKGKGSCKVSGARYLGQSAEHTTFIETACADGGPGWVAEMNPNDTVKSLLNCTQASGAGVKCELPTNVKH